VRKPPKQFIAQRKCLASGISKLFQKGFGQGGARIKACASAGNREALTCAESGKLEVQMEQALSPARKLAAGLMLISGVTHVAQLAVYPAHAHVVTAAIFGLLYFSIGLYLLRPKRAALWCAALFPLIGGSLGIYRFIVLQPNPFTVFHVIIDIAVISICVRLLLKREVSVSPA